LRNISEEKTKEKMIEISTILVLRKKQLNKYIKELKVLLKYPLRKI
jgi:hypothetical protein